MSVNTDLQAYKETKEFKEILKYAERKIENIENHIISVYNELGGESSDETHQLARNEFDVKALWDTFLEEMISKINHKKGKDLKDYYTDRKNASILFLYQPINQYGQSNSILRYTELDMKRFERSHYARIKDDIDSLIGNEEEEDLELGAF